MSLKSQALSVCRKCGQQYNVDIYKSVNTLADPELKAEVMSGRLFLRDCPHCGTGNLVTYDCLYHDPEARFMVWMLPFGEPEGAEKQAIMLQAKSMGDYRLRIVENAGDLMEKVIIFDAGLSDRCIELVKYVAGQEMKDVSNLHFYRIQDDTMVFSGVRNGKMDGFGIGLNVYEDCEGILSRNGAVAHENGFERIDSSWVDSIIR